MASYQLQPPASFDFKHPDAWPRWKQEFEQFRLASGLVQNGKERQVSTLLYCMLEDAAETLTSTGISDEDRKKYGSVMAKLDEFFRVRNNIIFECAYFNHHCQALRSPLNSS